MIDCFCCEQHSFLDIIMEGSLAHHRQSQTYFKHSWWVIDGVRGTLAKYATQRKLHRTGRSINIVHSKTKVVPIADKFQFELHTQNAVHTFEAPSADAVSQWMKALAECSKGYASGVCKVIASRGILHGKYIYVKVLGSGATAIVKMFTCHGKPYAIKQYNRIIKPEENLEATGGNGVLKRMSTTADVTDMKLKKYHISPEVRREIAILKKISKLPHVVNLMEVVFDGHNQQLYVVMEYLGGGPLLSWNNDEKRYTIPGQDNCWSESEAKSFMRDIVSGLRQLHKNKLCHRDIKPGNLLLTEDKKTCKIADFGEAHVFSSSKDPEICDAIKNNNVEGRASFMFNGATHGTYQFQAPEMLTGEDYSGFGADIWALGVTLYAMVYGILPFYDNNLMNMFDKIEAGRFDFPNAIGSDSLRDLISEMLTVDPAYRIDIDGMIKHAWFDNTAGNTNANDARLRSYTLVDVSSNDIHEAYELAPIQHPSKQIDMTKHASNQDHSQTSINLSDIAASYSPKPIYMQDISLPTSLDHLLPILAAQDHFTWCTRKTMNGWKHDKKWCATQKHHPSLVPYRRLSTVVQTKRRDSVLSILKGAIKLGYHYQKVKNTTICFPFDLTKIVLPNNLIVLSELLAENAHISWSFTAFSNGWQYGPNLNESTKTHPSLLPFCHLNPDDRSSKYTIVLTVLKTVIAMGYSIKHVHQHHHDRRHALHFPEFQISHF